VESEPRRAVARRDGDFSIARLYIDNISSVNRTLAFFNQDCQGALSSVVSWEWSLYFRIGFNCHPGPVATAFEVPVALKARAIRRVRRPTIPAGLADRVPPGQVIATRWPVLHRGEIPPFDPESWDFHVLGLVDAELRLTWDQWQALPTSVIAGDLHCVTRWSSLGHTWSGVSSRYLYDFARVSPGARFVVLHGEGGYSANLSLADFLDRRVVLATHHDGEPLTPEHGAPLRAVISNRYAWKSVKWLCGVEFLAQDRPGYWESFGYSNSADPWREERFDPE
jgi:DMSO/TMAO reductase YedYZ molybdopterin-dependent catalytic subunit